ncbi:MAG: polymerase sigma-E factor [Verrucomicrobiota bacterium]
MKAYQRPVRGWVAAHCPPGGDADEVAQKTFIAAYSRLGEFQEGTNLAAWIFTIARYQLRTEVTRLRRLADYHSRFAPDLVERELERRVEEPEGEVCDRMRYLGDCLGALGESARRFVEWRYREEISLEEMAGRTGRSVAAVKKQLWLVRQKLKECVDLKLSVQGEGRLA